MTLPDLLILTLSLLFLFMMNELRKTRRQLEDLHWLVEDLIEELHRRGSPNVVLHKNGSYSYFKTDPPPSFTKEN